MVVGPKLGLCMYLTLVLVVSRERAVQRGRFEEVRDGRVLEDPRRCIGQPCALLRRKIEEMCGRIGCYGPVMRNHLFTGSAPLNGKSRISYVNQRPSISFFVKK